MTTAKNDIGSPKGNTRHWGNIIWYHIISYSYSSQNLKLSTICKSRGNHGLGLWRQIIICRIPKIQSALIFYHVYQIHYPDTNTRRSRGQFRGAWIRSVWYSFSWALILETFKKNFARSMVCPLSKLRSRKWFPLFSHKLMSEKFHSKGSCTGHLTLRVCRKFSFEAMRILPRVPKAFFSRACVPGTFNSYTNDSGIFPIRCWLK